MANDKQLKLHNDENYDQRTLYLQDINDKNLELEVFDYPEENAKRNFINRPRAQPQPYDDNVSYVSFSEYKNEQDVQGIFYQKELKDVKINFAWYFWWLCVLLCISGYCIYICVKQQFSPYIFIPIIMGIIFNLYLLIKTISDWYALEQLYKMRDQDLYGRMFKQPFIKNRYEKMIFKQTFMHWLFAFSYLCVGILILFTFIIAYFINMYYNGGVNIKFGDLMIKFVNKDQKIIIDKTCWYIVIITTSLFSLILISHFYLSWSIYHRLNRYHVFISDDLINDEQRLALKKYANKVGLICFLVGTIIMGLLCFIIYKILNKNAKILPQRPIIEKK